MENQFDNKKIDNYIRLGLIILLVGISSMILAPFMMLLLWGIIIAVAIFPLFEKTVKIFSGKKGLTAVVFTFIGLLILIIPTVLLTESSAIGYQNLSAAFYAGELTIPPPSDDVKTWPLIGEKLYAIWDLASLNIQDFIVKYSDQVKKVGAWLFEALANLSLTILKFMASIIIAGVLLAKAEMGTETAKRFGRRMVGDRTEDFVKLTAGTIRSVVQGVLGIAFIQSLATGILLLIFSVPVPGLWALIVLILAIMQLPPLLVLGPIIIYVFSEQDVLPATIFTVFALLISISDSLLKPVFLGRGVDIPMMVVLLGAIGGMLVFGILGLFVGAVVLALSYKLIMAWLIAED